MSAIKLKRPASAGCGCGTENAASAGCCGGEKTNSSTNTSHSCCCNTVDSEAADNAGDDCICGESRDNKAVSSVSECCCGDTGKCDASSDKIQMVYSNGASWVTGTISTSVGPVQQVSTKLTFTDILGSIKARFGINRDNYKVKPGIYCVGNPDCNSTVLVTANYKMTFDSLRNELSGMSAWLLVLDTKGINVWCAAGKGTFGTKELVNRIAKVNLDSIVSHRGIILPQLGAPGVAAHEVLKQSGFKVTYGPVRASDLKAFVKNGMKADADMRTVKFTFIDRLVLTPIELVAALKISFIVFGAMFLLNTSGISHFGLTDLYAFLGTIFVGTFLTPVLLPFIPGRAFSFKGWLLGILWALSVNLINGFPGTPTYGWLLSAAYLLILPAISSYLAMNFTGCSTYTSFTGVKREMQIALPLIIVSMGLGMILLLVDMVYKLLI